MFTVLIVDDEEGFLQIIQVILRRAGYNTLIALNGAEALESVYLNNPDIIILDDMMPGVTGGDVCSHLKSDPQVCHIPVIMHSAGAKIRNQAYIEQIGADGVLFKPSLPNEILEKVNSCLEARVY